MIRNVYIKLSLIVISMFLAVAVAYARFDMFTLMGYQASNTDKTDIDDKLKSQSSESNEIGETDSPVYFSVFKFVNNFAPAKQEN